MMTRRYLENLVTETYKVCWVTETGHFLWMGIEGPQSAIMTGLSEAVAWMVTGYRCRCKACLPGRTSVRPLARWLLRRAYADGGLGCSVSSLVSRTVFIYCLAGTTLSSQKCSLLINNKLMASSCYFCKLIRQHLILTILDSH